MTRHDARVHVETILEADGLHECQAVAYVRDPHAWELGRQWVEVWRGPLYPESDELDAADEAWTWIELWLLGEDCPTSADDDHDDDGDEPVTNEPWPEPETAAELVAV